MKKPSYKTKINKIEKKIADHDHAKYVTTQEFNKLTADNFAARLAQAKLASKADIADFVKKADFDDNLKNLDKDVTSYKTNHVQVENELNEPLVKLVKLLSAKDYSFFIGTMYFTSNDGSENMFVYQPTFNMLELRKDKITEYVIGWKSKGVHNSKCIALRGAFLPNIKHFSKKIGKQFNCSSCTTKQLRKQNYKYLHWL